MRDAPRKNPRDHRKEKWIAHDVDPEELDLILVSIRVHRHAVHVRATAGIVTSFPGARRPR